MSKKINTRIVNKHDTEANWNNAINFIPLQGELIIYDVDDKYNYERCKIGDGETSVIDLPFVNNLNLINGKGSYSLEHLLSNDTTRYNKAEGAYSVVLGQQGIAYGRGAISLGNSTQAGYSYTEWLSLKNLEDTEDNYNTFLKDPNNRYQLVYGQSSKAYGKGSLAGGLSNTTVGNYSVALGASNTASGYTSITLGELNRVPAMNSTAVGKSNKINSKDTGSTLIGYNNETTGESTWREGQQTSEIYTIGYSNKARGHSSAILGLNSETGTKEYNFIFGSGSKGQGSYTAQMGFGNIAGGTNVVQVGKGLISNYNNTIALGFFNNDRYVDNANKGLLLSVGNGTSADKRSNALEILRDGRVKVLTTPTEDLDVIRKVDVQNGSLLNIQNSESTDSLVQTYTGDVDATHFGNINTGESAAVFGEANSNTKNRTLVSGKMNMSRAANSFVVGLGNGRNNVTSGDYAEDTDGKAWDRAPILAGANLIVGGLLNQSKEYDNGQSAQNSIISGQSNVLDGGDNTLIVGLRNRTFRTSTIPSQNIIGGNTNEIHCQASLTVGNHNINRSSSSIVAGSFNEGKEDTLLELGKGRHEDAIMTKHGWGNWNDYQYVDFTYNKMSFIIDELILDANWQFVDGTYHIIRKDSPYTGNIIVKNGLSVTTLPGNILVKIDFNNLTVTGLRSNAFEVFKDGRAKLSGKPKENNDILRWQEKVELDDALFNEKTRAESQEQALFEKIEVEETRAKNVEGELNENIINEVARATATGEGLRYLLGTQFEFETETAKTFQSNTDTVLNSFTAKSEAYPNSSVVTSYKILIFTDDECVISMLNENNNYRQEKTLSGLQLLRYTTHTQSGATNGASSSPSATFLDIFDFSSNTWSREMSEVPLTLGTVVSLSVRGEGVYKVKKV